MKTAIRVDKGWTYRVRARNACSWRKNAKTTSSKFRSVPPRIVTRSDIKASVRVPVIPRKYFRINDFQLLSTGRVCAYSSFESICRPQFPSFLIEFFLPHEGSNLSFLSPGRIADSNWKKVELVSSPDDRPVTRGAPKHDKVNTSKSLSGRLMARKKLALISMWVAQAYI